MTASATPQNYTTLTDVTRMVRGAAALRGASWRSLAGLSTLGATWVRAALSTGCRGAGSGGVMRPALVVALRLFAALI
jgi:hypothetical protein